MVIVVGNGDTSSNPGQGYVSLHTNALGKGINPSFLPSSFGKIVEQNVCFNFDKVISLGKGKL